MSGRGLMNASVIILAGGRGERTGLNIPKQFIELNGKSVIQHSIDSFVDMGAKVIVVVPESIDDQSSLFFGQNIKVVRGGPTRTDSLNNGLTEVKTDLVLIHDSSRPIVVKKVVDDVIDSLSDYVCAYPVLDLKNSIVVDKDGELESTPERNKLKEIQTPQGFQLKWLKRALEELGDQHIHIPELIRRLGKPVKHVQGSPWLFKITWQPDVYAAHAYLKEFEKSQKSK